MTAFYYLFIPLGIAVAIGSYLLHLASKRRSLMESLDLGLLLIKIPKEAFPEGAQEKEAKFKTELANFEQLLSNLAAFKRTFVFEVAVPHVGEEIHFYLAVPKVVIEAARSQVQSLWSGASVALASDDYSIFNPQGSVASAHLLLKENYSLPIRTYRELNADSFASIVGGFAKISEVGEGAAMQVILKSAGSSSKKKIQEFIRLLKRGEPLKKVFGGGSSGLSLIGEALNPQVPQKEKKEKVVDEEAVRALEAKISKPLFLVNVRVVASAPSLFQAGSILDGILSGFSQFGAPQRNSFRIVKSKSPAEMVRRFIYRTFESSETMILSSEEVASFYHLPTAGTETPRVKWLKAKEAPPPPNLPGSGVLLGESLFRGEVKKIYLTEEDRRRHVYMIGQTGTGKSTLLANMIVEDIKRGKGVAMIDPHGDLAEHVLGHIPEARRQDLIYFDPSDTLKPLGLNMLDYNSERPEEKTFIVNEMQGIFNKLFPPETMGPMFEQYMRNALLLLMEDVHPPAGGEPATLIEVPRVFTDQYYRERKLKRIKNPVVIDFWEKEAVKAGGEAALQNITPYITSKFNNFISNDYLRPIIGQVKSAFNFREVMDSGKILLINLSKGRIGDLNAGLLGMIFSGKILMAALSRVDITEAAKRRDFNFYIDEFQNFTTDSISVILSEARKYRLSLVVAHQFIAQLTEKIRDAVFGNVGSQIVFRVGATDAEFLVKQFEPTFSQSDLINIDNFRAYVKLLINGETAKPFNIETFPLGAGNREFADELKVYSRDKYGMERQVVEEEIYKRLRG